ALGGDRMPLVKAVEHWCREYGLDDSAADIERNVGLLLSGALAGKSESDQHVYLVAALAHACGLDSEDAMIHWGNWKIGAYDDYFDILKPVLPAVSAEYCEFLRSGRALFGSGIDTEWAYYGYL